MGLAKLVVRVCSSRLFIVCRREATDLSEHLRLALARLPDRQAEVFCLRMIEEMSYEEIATQLDVEVNHVGVLSIVLILDCGNCWIIS